MNSQFSVKLSKLVEDYHLEILCKGSDYEKIAIKTEDVNRPGLQLAGFFDYFDPTRIQVIGIVETTYLSNFSSEERRRSFERLMEQEIPVLVIAHDLEPYPECLEMAQKYGRTVLRTHETTSAFMNTVITGLRQALAPRITRHGVLVEVYGEGVLLMGESGVGKSETAIELVKRGHRLIADDAVEIKKIGPKALLGTAPELIRHYVELRGIGVIDVRRLFGVSAVKMDTVVDLVINLEQWKDGMFYDRLGLEEHTVTLLDVKVPYMTIPVKPGRNLAVIVEVAAMNNRHKKMGYNAALEFTEQINRHFDQNTNQGD